MLVAAWVLPIVLATVAFDWSGEVERDNVSEADSVPVRVGQREEVFSSEATALLDVAPGADIVSQRTGTVTDVVAEAGTEFVDGQTVIAVDGRPVWAQTKGVPLYRDLMSGLSGPDVMALHEVLGSQGFEVGLQESQSNMFGDETADALLNWERQSGHAAPDGIYEVGDSMFLGSTGGRVDSMTVRIGDIITSGQVVARLEASVTRIEVIPVPRIPLTHPLAERPVEVVAAGTPIAISGLVVEGDEVPALTDVLLDSGLLTVGALGVGANGLPVDVPNLQVRLATPLIYGSVPTTYTFSTQDGLTCVRAVDTASDLPQSVPIDADAPLSTTFGEVLVQEELIGHLVTPIDDDSPPCS